MPPSRRLSDCQNVIMAGDYVPDEFVAQVDGLTALIEGERETLLREHADLRELDPRDSKYRAAAKAVILATSRLLEVEDDLAALRAAEQQRLQAARIRHVRAAERRRLWLIAAVIAAAGAGVVSLAGAGVIPGAVRIAIGAGILLTAVLMAYSMDGEVVRAAGVHAVDLRKAVVAALFAGVAVIGALFWPLAGLAVFPAIGVAAIPSLVESVVAGRERASELEGRTRRG
jgi:hypothetical protein